MSCAGTISLADILTVKPKSSSQTSFTAERVHAYTAESEVPAAGRDPGGACRCLHIPGELVRTDTALGGSVTVHGHRVAVYLDARREDRGEEWDQGLAAGLLYSLCFLPLLSYGCTAPLASLGSKNHGPSGESEESWPVTPLGMGRLQGAEGDSEDGVLKVVRIVCVWSAVGDTRIGVGGWW
jgi:hypothetical protein